MLRVGVTGGIAAGKSTVVAVLRRLGAVVVDADAIARDVLSPGAPAVGEVVAAFGDHVLGTDGGVDRPALGRVVFADPQARARLEAITHPRIQAEAARQFAAAPADAIVVHDIPLLVELGLADRYHLVVVVHAPAADRMARLVRERGMVESDARARVAAQATDDQRRAAADVRLDNTGAADDLRVRVAALWHDRLVPFEANLRGGVRAVRPAQPVVVDPDPSWAVQGERLVARVRRAAGDRGLDVAHIGSTAVPGLPAKDVIDLQVVVRDLPTAHSVAATLDGAGLVAVTDVRWDRPLGTSDRVAKAFSANADPGRAVNCHVRAADNPAVHEVLAVRDRLRADPAARTAYARLKRDLASRSWPDVDAYATAKTPFLTALLTGGGFRSGHAIIGRVSLPRDDTQRLDDLRALELLRPLLPGAYLPWTEASIRPAALVAMCNDVVVRRRRTVVELGSGITTLVLSRLLGQLGGRLVTVEHDGAWLEIVRDQVARTAGAPVVDLHHAPLVDGWYDRSVVGKALADIVGPVDLLVVDGPPAWRPGTELSRLPAADVLVDHLADDATVILDDVQRPGEREIARRWAREHGWPFTVRESEGIAVAVLGGDGYTI